MKKLLIATLALAASTAMAGEGYYVGFELGASRDNMKTTEANGGVSHYAFSKKQVKLPLLGVGVGYRFNSNFSTGLSFNYLPERDASHNSENGYTLYTFNSYALMLNGKFNIETGSALSPFIKASVGYAKNKFSYDASNIDPNSLVPITPAKGSVSKNKFAYGLDLGLDYAMSDNAVLGASFGFMNTGKVSVPALQETQEFKYYTFKLGLTYNF